MPAEKDEAKAKPEISMRHSKLTATEAAILSGELNKPSWESRNEGIHERVSFEDSIWGFDLAGGSFYKTPLRVTYVKPDSRAAKAGIRAGDRLKRINDIDTSTLTIQEAHDIIIESGVYLRLAVTAPEDEEDSYGCWEDQIEDGYDSEEERRKEQERAKKRVVHAKVSSYWSLQWPWVSKRRVIYRESNCFMVPSQYETKHRDKFPVETNFGPKVLDDIVLQSTLSAAELAQNVDPVVNGDAETNTNVNELKPIENLPQEMNVDSAKPNEGDQIAAMELSKTDAETKTNVNEVEPIEDLPQETDVNSAKPNEGDHIAAMELSKTDTETKTNVNEVETIDNLPQEMDVDSGKPNEGDYIADMELPNTDEEFEQKLDAVLDTTPLSNIVNMQPDTINTNAAENLQNGLDVLAATMENDNSMDDTKEDLDEEEESFEQDDEVLNQVLKTGEGAKDEEDQIFNDILNDSDIQADANAMDENKR